MEILILAHLFFACTCKKADKLNAKDILKSPKESHNADMGKT